MKFFNLLIVLTTMSIFTACGSNEQNEAELKSPAIVHPPEEAIPDSTKLVNDSVIVPNVDSGTLSNDTTR